jgi:hypothetical protein
MSSNPTITATIRDVNSDTIALTGDDRVLIRYRSDAQVTMSVTVYGEAVLNEDMCIIRNGGDTEYGRSCTFYNVESDTFRFSAEDSRGRIGTANIAVDMIPYVELTCNMANNKPNTNGEIRLEWSGDYFDGSFGEESNTLTVQYRYTRPDGTSTSWRNMPNITISGNTYTAYVDIAGLDYQSSYTFETRAEDKLSIASNSESGVSSLPVFHWSKSDFVFEVPVTFKSSGEARIYGDLRLKNDGNYGNYLRFGDGNNCFITESSDDEMSIFAKSINLVTFGGEVTVNGNSIASESGVWTPTLSGGAVDSYSSRKGWYTRSGNVVTIGFYIKANCYSDYESESVVITGLPYNPDYRASGGGICAGAFVGSGWVFQCYVAETYGEITVRVQWCDTEWDGNLSTSAGGCWYPEGGGEITLSGTITYYTTD